MVEKTKTRFRAIGWTLGVSEYISEHVSESSVRGDLFWRHRNDIGQSGGMEYISEHVGESLVRMDLF